MGRYEYERGLKVVVSEHEQYVWAEGESHLVLLKDGRVVYCKRGEITGDDSFEAQVYLKWRDSTGGLVETIKYNDVVSMEINNSIITVAEIREEGYIEDAARGEKYVIGQSLLVSFYGGEKLQVVLAGIEFKGADRVIKFHSTLDSTLVGGSFEVASGNIVDIEVI